MESYYSLIKFVSNLNSNENIVVGLLVLSNEKLYYNISQSKLKFVKRLNSSSYSLFQFALDKFNFNLQDDNEVITEGQLNIFSSSINKEFLNRLSIYQNGVFQISRPEKILKEFDINSFNLYFNKFVGIESSEPNSQLYRKDLKEKLKKYYSKESFKRVDLHYKIKPEILTGLFFPTEVDFIAKNGQLLVGQSIDFKATPQTIAKNFNEFENLVYNLEKFSKSRNIGNGLYKLIVGLPKANTEQEKLFNKIYKKRNEAPFEFIRPEELEKVAKLLDEKDFIKFSEYVKS